MTKYPSLYAALEPDDVNGRRGFTVRCTATRRSIGFIWWEAIGGTAVVWHWRTGAHFGERSTERNAVQALRDVANVGSVGQLPLEPAEDTPAPARPRAAAPRASKAAPAPTPAAPPARRIVWNDAAPAFDVTAAIAAGLKGKA